MFVKFMNFEPEQPIWIRAELIVTVVRPAGCKYTEIMLNLISPAGALAYRVYEEPEDVIALLTQTLH